MQKHWPKLLVLMLLASVAPASAERFATLVDHGAECPFEHARMAAAHQDVVLVSTGTTAPGGTVFGLGHASIFAP